MFQSICMGTIDSVKLRIDSVVKMICKQIKSLFDMF